MNTTIATTNRVTTQTNGKAKAKAPKAEALKTITIEIPVREVIEPSSTGKTMVVGAWKGSTGIIVNGREVFASGVAFYYPKDKGQK